MLSNTFYNQFHATSFIDLLIYANWKHVFLLQSISDASNAIVIMFLSYV